MIIPEGQGSPHEIHAPKQASELAEFVATYRDRLLLLLQEHGALLFRDFRVDELSAFERFIEALGLPTLDYLNRSTPRTRMTKNIYSATEYPSRLPIALHCENSYQRRWPLKIAFCCLCPAEQGGQTPLADMEMVTRSLSGELLDRFEARQVRYIRHFHDAMDLSWQTTFGVQSVKELEAFCRQQDIELEWKGGTLCASHLGQGTAHSPTSARSLFFNQAHLFHYSNLDPATQAALIDMYGLEQLPRNALFGDGGPIAASDLDHIRVAFNAHQFTFAWRAGDVLLLDNMRMAHGRQPFQGRRQVLVSLLEEYVSPTLRD